MRREFLIVSFLILAGVGYASYYYPYIAWSLIILLPIFFLGIYEMFQSKRTIMRNYPLFGRARYIMEELRPKIYQYFIESDTDGTPINRILRSVVYQRAKEQLDTTPFGTQEDIYATGYEWINHSMNPLGLHEVPPESLRVTVGGKDCKHPYSLSLFNVSAMSYGALSAQAIQSLNKGAKAGNFAHNTGEGGISPHHLKHGGDLIWQIGTGYFGCRTLDGKFCPDNFKKKAALENVKMIEIKLSQGAKPGHGGILPAEKNTSIIAEIRGVEAGTKVESPSSHNAFSNHDEMLQFIAQLRELSGGKPIGIKLCVGIPEEFEELCQKMVKIGVYPDFIAVDGGEGGTGAAPLEFSNSIGMSLKDGLIIVNDLLTAYGLREEIKIIVSGKMISGFHIVKAIALGADACYSARAMMLALGCIQALLCNTNKCPTGVATQDPSLTKGLVVEDKYKRVKNYHFHTLESVAEILAATGTKSLSDLSRRHIWRRISATEIKTYYDLYPPKTTGEKLQKAS